ncbi:MAG: polyphosphate:AMP phosphotransferase [Lachnospiraceae bacterium]|nr:polyphosphate:AMP phosphotransferase [Lachnospiraceae bacterium]
MAKDQKVVTKAEKDHFRAELANRQQVIKNAKLPVVVLIEGYSAAGKGSAIGSIIHYMDPRFFKVYNMDVVSEDEARKPFLYRYAQKLPKQGQIAIFDGGWMDATVHGYVSGALTKKEYEKQVTSIRQFERQLVDNGYLLVKFFLEIDEEEQKKRLGGLADRKNTKYRVSDYDMEQNKHFKEYRKAFREFIKATDTGICPWNCIRADHRDLVEKKVASTITAGIDAMASHPHVAELQENPFPMVEFHGLSSYDLTDKVLSDEEYRKELKECQKKLAKLHNKIYRKKIPVIIAYEGWDAAGKGGNIKRIAQALDPRGYEVFPIASPSTEEKARHYLWRFWTRLPRSGHIAIFDRTWYGRVMVERLEGFCSENDWKRAYNEMNEFERDLTDWGAIVIKFWVQIDKDTQLARFTDRQNTPEKQWKITEEDWRNREKWDLYEGAVNEMIEKTNTTFAPWHILESNDKKYARIKAMKIVIQAIEERLANPI